MPDWQWITEDQFYVMLSTEEKDLGFEALETYRKYRVSEAYKQTVSSVADTQRRFFVVARKGRKVIIYDDQEEDFALADIAGRDRSCVENIDYYGEFYVAVTAFLDVV